MCSIRERSILYIIRVRIKHEGVHVLRALSRQDLSQLGRPNAHNGPSMGLGNI